MRLKQGTLTGLLLTAPLLGHAVGQDRSLPGGPPPTSAPEAAPTSECVFNNIPGHPKSQVPGLPGAFFEPGLGTDHFDRPYGSPTGRHVFTAQTTLPPGQSEALILDNLLILRDGVQASWVPGVENVFGIDQRIGINDAGVLAFAAATNGPGNANDYIVRFNSGVFANIAKEGDPIPAFGGNNYDDDLESPVITNLGAVGFVADGIDGSVTTLTDGILILGGQVLMQQGVTVPPGQLGPVSPINDFDLSDFWVTPAGNRFLVQGDLSTSPSIDDVVIVDGTVVIQEGFPIPSAPQLGQVGQDAIHGVHLAPQGNWFARGSSIDGRDWALRDGLPIGITGAPILAGSAEAWDDTTFPENFFLHVGNGLGDFVLGGTTSAAGNVNGVLVFNDTSIVCRESDPIDLDGNGLFDDDAFFDTFGDDDAILDDNRQLRFMATIKDGLGQRRGQGYFLLDLQGADQPVVYCTAKVNTQGCLPTIGSTGTPSASSPQAFDVLATMVINNKNGMLFYGFAPNNIPFKGGTLCVRPPISRTPVQGSGGNPPPNDCSGQFHFDFNAWIQSGIDPQLTVGLTVFAQYWYRDPGSPMPSHTGLTDAVRFPVAP